MSYLGNKLKPYAKWAVAAGIRAFKTAAQTLSATLVGVTSFGDLNWGVVLSATGLAALLSLTQAVGGLPEVDNAPLKK